MSDELHNDCADVTPSDDSDLCPSTHRLPLWVPDERTGLCVEQGTDNVCDCLGGCEVYGDDRWVEIAHNLNKEMGK